MKYIYLALLLCNNLDNLFAQKLIIDTNAYDNWTNIGDGKISNEGNYFTYAIWRGSHFAKKNSYTVKSTVDNWELNFLDCKEMPRFSDDEKYCFLVTKSDSLKVINLQKRAVTTIPNVSTFKLTDYGANATIVYWLNDEFQTIVMRNLDTDKKRIISGKARRVVSEDGSEIVSQKFLKGGKQQLEWLNVLNKKAISIWTGEEMQDLVVDFKNQQLAFKSKDTIVYYKIGSSKSLLLTNQRLADQGIKLKIGRLDRFSSAGDRLFISLDDQPNNLKEIIKEAPEVWSYLDKKLQTVQEGESNQQSYLGVVGIADQKCNRLQLFREENFYNRQYDDLVLSCYNSGGGDYQESWWNSSNLWHYDLLNTKTGERKSLPFIKNNGIYDGNPVVSPLSRYIVYYNIARNEYFSYEIASGKNTNLTIGIKTSWRIVHSVGDWQLRGIAGWLANDEGVLIYDSHDIWLLDPSGIKPARNITSNYGHKNDIIFSLALEDSIIKNEKLYLAAFDLKNKYNGFYLKNMNSHYSPVKLTMGAHLFKISSRYANAFFDFSPIKALRKKIFLVKRQGTNEAPNFFMTKDFISFKRLTNLRPHYSYNWHTAELLNWNSLDGRKLQGILYKPENFDSKKKYPVIFYYYERLTDGLYSFLRPDYSRGRIDISTYTSNGYLVFTPDIYYSTGDPMQGTYNSIVSAAKYVSKLSFVDTHKMGLQGHSFGAIQTNYLITKTRLFNAACSSSGLGDWVSGYSSLRGNERNGYGPSAAGLYEGRGQNQMGASLWGNLAGYLKNSPVLFIDKVKTPILLMHTKNDQTCPFSNILEFFLGLRRMGKKAWMIVYNKAEHSLDNSEESKDFTIRMMQFFDYYLKDKPAPEWMLNGISAKDRAFGAGTQLDTTGRSPGPGLLKDKDSPEAQHESHHILK